jgi:hypothetical protein
MTTQSKLSLAELAMQLRDEQIEARIIHYKADLATSPELDKITEQIVSNVQMLQRAVKGSQSSPPPAGPDRTQLEIELIQSLKEMLSRVFRPNKLSVTIERRLAEVAKRFARLFFESELHEKLRGSQSEAKLMRHPEQALYHALTRHTQSIERSLAGFDYAMPEIRDRARESLQNFIKELRNSFLGRTTPELNLLVKHLSEVLRIFFTHELPPALGELAWEVVKEARLSEAQTSAGYKLSANVFGTFRVAFERRFLQRLVPFATDEMLKRVREGANVRIETIHFVADPQIFSDVCEVVCDAVYDHLYNDGFLDLPSDWRVRASSSS